MNTSSSPAQGSGPASPDSAPLTIGDVAERTGVSVPTLRMWESRHGFPTPERLDSGHRRYREHDVRAVLAVVRHRDAGVRLDVAIGRAIDDALEAARPAAPSIYAGLRRTQPQLATYRLRKSTLLGLSWAIEDEFCAKADRAHLFGAFQHEDRYRPARARWRELARVAGSAYAFAEFARPDPDAHPVEVALAPDSPMRREWAVVCDSTELPAALTAWELPGQDGIRDADRLFESIWTVEPHAVREAALLCAAVARDAGAPGTEAVIDDLRRPLAPGSTDLGTVTSLLNRVVSYVDAAGGR